MFINSSSLSFLVSIGFGLRKVCVQTGSKLNRRIHLSSSQNETFLSGVVLKGKQIRVSQHYFEEPVLQPRSTTNQRREADLTGLKVWSSSIPLLTYFSDIVLPILLRNRGLDIENVNEIKVLELGSGT